MSNIPSDLLFAESHEWVRKNSDGTITVGISDHAQDALGDIVFVELPAVDSSVNKGEDICVVESVKAASDIYAPCSGTIVAVNTDLEDTPEAINEDAYGNWLFKLGGVDLQDGSLLTAEAYGKMLESE